MSSQPDSQPDSQAGSHTKLPTGSSGNPVVASTENSSGDATPVRVGLIGLDRSGLFHAERLSLRAEIEVVAACDLSSGGSRRLFGARGGDRRVYSRVEDLLARSDFGTVLIAGPIEQRAECGVRALEAGKDVALDSPPTSNGGQMQQLLAAARRTGRRLSILPTRRDGADFRTVFQIVRDVRLGHVYSARLLSWGKAVPDAFADRKSDVRTPEAEPDAFTFFAYHYVDQLVQLIGGRPRSVFSRILVPSATEPASTAFTLAIAFEPPIDALIDVNLASGAVLQTGWMLAGDRGGYSGGRIYLQDPSGEVCDAPVSQSGLPEIDVYAELVTSARGEPGPTASACEAEVVMRVIDAARESSRTGQCVSIEP
jgi:predicted dehydrogenase